MDKPHTPPASIEEDFRAHYGEPDAKAAGQTQPAE
jgi:hypothetical protein